jgi:7-cyano-7-deazaguanine synthase in queuosine biosynthesis
MSPHAEAAYIPEIKIDVVEPGRRARKGRTALVLGHDVGFSTAGLESYAFAKWERVIYDAMVVSAAIEYGDRILKRPPRGWARRIAVRIPVHDPGRWNEQTLATALHDAAEFLTGDYWSLEFVQRSGPAPHPTQDNLSLPVETQAVLAYSDGLDSRAVAGIQSQFLGNKLVRVRVGSKSWDRAQERNAREPFAKVPYEVSCTMANRESSARSRGFKFALISSIAAYLADAGEVIVPESGQGAFGPALINVGHAYPDYRNHPLFTRRMERFIRALLKKEIQFVFPRLWHTKGETLREFVSLPGERDWETTRSCWRSNRWSSVNGKLRQCGVCAACMLRRLSVHAAGLTEQPDVYVCKDMRAKTLDEGIDKDFIRQTPVFREYAIAGILHLDHLADMAENDAEPLVARHAMLLAPALGLSREEAGMRLNALLRKHAIEWKSYMDSLGEESFVRQWARTDR